jgi:hypothetical protein
MTNDALRHPVRALKLAFRLWLLRGDLRSPDLPTDIPPALEPFRVGELLPWKGTMLRVGKIVGGDFPALILIPVSRTHGAKLKGLRNLRDSGRHALAEQRAVKKSLDAATR